MAGLLPVIAQHDEGDTTHQPTEQKGEEHGEKKEGFNAAKRAHVFHLFQQLWLIYDIRQMNNLPGLSC